ncbi:class I tRNA ligase family protein [bacterium]|nr:class I tRNA ligase family protein [bacterium]
MLIVLNKTIKNVGELIENYKHNVAISQLMVLTNTFQNHKITKKTFLDFLIMLSCFAPFVSQEM